MADEAKTSGGGCGCLILILLLVFIIVNVDKRDRLLDQTQKTYICYVKELINVYPSLEIFGYIDINERNRTYEIIEYYDTQIEYYNRFDDLSKNKQFRCFRVDGKTYSQQLVDNDLHVYNLWIWIPAGILITELVCIVLICAGVFCMVFIKENV